MVRKVLFLSAVIVVEVCVLAGLIFAITSDSRVAAEVRASAPTVSSGSVIVLDRSGLVGVFVAPSPASSSPPPAVLPVPTEPVSDVRSFSVDVSASGGRAELDKCSDWTHLQGFTTTAAIPQPILAAHNRCGGDVVLGMAVGDEVLISGESSPGVYTVSGFFDTSYSPTPEDFASKASGDVLLQTCFYGRQEMRFAVLVRK